MLSSNPTHGLYLANEARRRDFESRAAQERRAAIAQQRGGGLPPHREHLPVRSSWSNLGTAAQQGLIVVANQRHERLLREADQYRLSMVAVGQGGPSLLARMRQTAGALLVTVGTRLRGRPAARRVPLDASAA